MMAWSACLQRSETDKLGPPVSARPVVSYTISWDIIRSRIAAWQRRGEGCPGIDPVDQFSPERAEPRVIGAIGGDGFDLFSGRDL